jgi:hypothetical protein
MARLRRLRVLWRLRPNPECSARNMRALPRWPENEFFDMYLSIEES